MARNSKGQETNDLKIIRNGRQTLMSVGKYVLPEWRWVRVTKTHKEGNKIWLTVEALELVEKSA